MQKINLHTHTTFCDGKDTPEEMVLAAITKGFSALGFSGHSLFPFARSWHIAPRDFKNYERTILELKEKYKSKIDIYLGYEADFYPGITVPSKKFYKAHGLNPSYLIASTHYVLNKKGSYTVDNTTEEVRRKLIIMYGDGKNWSSVDGRRAVCQYFETERKMLENADFDIIGHIDLIRKRNGVLKFFDENESWYKKELKATARSIAHAGVIVEINTGAIARGAMDDVYPSLQFLELLHEYKVPLCINSDCHDKDYLDCAYERAVTQARNVGYKKLFYPVGDKLIIVKI